MVSIREYVTYVSKHELKCYIQQNMTEKEECEYYISEDYEVHLNYLIESWITNIKNELNDIECNEIFQDRARKLMKSKIAKKLISIMLSKSPMRLQTN